MIEHATVQMGSDLTSFKHRLQPQRRVSLIGMCKPEPKISSK